MCLSLLEPLLYGTPLIPQSTVIQHAAIPILLVEDNPAHAALIRRSLEHHLVPHEITHLSDGETALAYLLRRGAYTNASHPAPTLILLDLRLPRMDGLDVLEHVKTSKELQHIPVVILTTSAADQDVARAYERHANSYVVKPLGLDAFDRLLEELLTYWTEHNHYPW